MVNDLPQNQTDILDSPRLDEEVGDETVPESEEENPEELSELAEGDVEHESGAEQPADQEPEMPNAYDQRFEALESSLDKIVQSQQGLIGALTEIAQRAPNRSAPANQPPPVGNVPGPNVSYTEEQLEGMNMRQLLDVAASRAMTQINQLTPHLGSVMLKQRAMGEMLDHFLGNNPDYTFVESALNLFLQNQGRTPFRDCFRTVRSEHLERENAELKKKSRAQVRTSQKRRTKAQAQSQKPTARPKQKTRHLTPQEALRQVQQEAGIG